MSVFDRVRIVIYRVNKKGLEVFLLDPENTKEEHWQIPMGQTINSLITGQGQIIELDPVKQENGEMVRAWAIEGDWHEIPSIRKMIKKDVLIVKNQIKQQIPDLEKGTYFAVKEAFKKVLPEQYALIKELKEIVNERNQTMYI